VGDLAFGEENPTHGETPVSWQTWKDAVGVLPVIIGDSDWGQLELEFGEEGRSSVYDLVNYLNKKFTLILNRYQSGQGTAVLQIRGSATSFTQNDNVVEWITYTEEYHASWRYVQVRIIKS